MDLTPEQAKEIIDIYRKIPHHYIADVYGDKLWQKQNEIVESVFKYRETAVKTCNAVGKSFVAARVAHAFLDLIPGSLVVTTAPTWRQVKDVLWREFAVTHTKARFPLGGNLSQTGFEYAKDWYAVGLSTKYPENFFGYHADYILVIVDEAGGVPEPIFKGVKAITPNVNARVLYIGNPTDPSGTFYDVFQKPTVNKITISAFDSPNFTAAGIPDLATLLRVFEPPEGVNILDHKPLKDIEYPYPALISPEVVYERYHEWGVDSPMWQALIMGEFPTQAENSLLPMNLVQQAMSGLDRVDVESGKTYAELSGWEIETSEKAYGLDIARFGSDSTVLTPRRGYWIDEQISWNKADTVETAQNVLRIINPFEPVHIKIDDTGNGGGTTDHLNYLMRERQQAGDAPYGLRLEPYNMASAPVDKDKFHDITSEMYWNLRELLLARKMAFTFRDDELLSELTARQWRLLPNGKIKVESKEEFRKRTGRKSPDKSDSLALALYEGNTVGAWSAYDDMPQMRIDAPITADLDMRY